jgi:hypothetical protein
MGHFPTRSKRQRKQAGGSRTLRFTLIKQDKFSIPAQERKPRQMKFYLTSQEQHIYYHIQYGWIPHNAGFGFLDIAGAALGQIHF